VKIVRKGGSIVDAIGLQLVLTDRGRVILVGPETLLEEREIISPERPDKQKQRKRQRPPG
jgi:hypothetical protein